MQHLPMPLNSQPNLLSLNQEKLQWSKLESTNAENCMSEAMASSTGTYSQQKNLEKSSEQVTARYA
jgi:hypothetical protein